MSLDELRKPLLRLLNEVVADSGGAVGELDSLTVPRRDVPIPNDLLETGEEGFYVLSLTGEAAIQFHQCLERLFREGEDGELEHLAQRDIQRALERLVCRVWIDRATLKLDGRRNLVNQFLEEHRQTKEQWHVLWEIENLFTTEPFEVAGVTFLPFVGSHAEQWMPPEGSPWRKFDEELVGRTFARATVKAGSREKALPRGKVAIDDALNVLRVVLSADRFVLEQQRMQRRGTHYFARPTSNASSRGSGWQLESRPIKLEVGETSLRNMEKRHSELALALSEKTTARIREPMHRALLWIGSSYAREDMDDKVVDLCSALESLLSLPSDRRKAEAIVVRYILAGIAAGENSYVKHPLLVYDLYLLRNQIVHGSARRVSGKEDYRSLRYVALNSFDRISTIVAADSTIKSMYDLFQRISHKEALDQVAAFVNRYSSNYEAVRNVGKLVSEWLDKQVQHSSIGPDCTWARE